MVKLFSLWTFILFAKLFDKCKCISLMLTNDQYLELIVNWWKCQGCNYSNFCIESFGEAFRVCYSLVNIFAFITSFHTLAFSFHFDLACSHCIGAHGSEQMIDHKSNSKKMLHLLTIHLQKTKKTAIFTASISAGTSNASNQMSWISCFKVYQSTVLSVLKLAGWMLI